MIAIALFGGALIGLRCRAGLLLVGVAAIFAAGVVGYSDPSEAPSAIAIALAFLMAAVTQVTAFAVHILTEGLGDVYRAPA